MIPLGVLTVLHDARLVLLRIVLEHGVRVRFADEVGFHQVFCLDQVNVKQMARMVEAASTTAKSTRLFTAMFTACCNIGGFFTSS